MDIILEELGDNYNPRALIVRGDALYNLGNFETALINYHRAKKEAKIKEKQSILSRIHRTELAVSNAVGPTASHYYKHLEKFLFKIPEDIIGLPIFQLIKIKDANIESTKIKDKKFLGNVFLFRVGSFYQIKFIYSEKATKFCEISTVDLTGTA